MIFKKQVSELRFKELAYPHMKLLYNVALKYVGNVFDAEDIVQETYLMAFNKFHQLKEPESCKPWLLRILRNNFLKSCRKNQNQQRLSETAYIEFLKNHLRQKGADEMLVEESENKTLNEAIDKLPVKYREVLALYYMDDMLYKEIAQILNIPMGTVMSRLTRAREGIKTNLLKARTQKNMVTIHFKGQYPKHGV
ncbi:MAG: sigma-70 family RNA polymerase sigma factor [Proteobacteria bacterium]|nr:sigma-70 family RNA polymerase sigma factor [Pseudomonadota bacterium]